MPLMGFTSTLLRIAKPRESPLVAGDSVFCSFRVMLVVTPGPSLNASHHTLLAPSSLVRRGRLARNHALLDKDVNQTLQRLHILPGQQVVVHGNGHEVDEAAV